MPNPVVVLQAVLVAAAIAALIPIACDRLDRQATIGLRACGWPLGIGCGAIAGMWMLGVQPSGRFTGDQERLAFIVLPLVTLMETLLSVARPTRWWAVLLRALVASSVCPILLYGSVYLAGPPSAGQHGWKPTDTALMLGGVGAAMTAALLALTDRGPRPTGPAELCCLGLATAAAGLTTMLSGYLTGGQQALPIAAVMMVACGMSFGRPISPAVSRVGFVGLAGILIIGHFFGSLTALHASMLSAAPFICWLVNRVPQERLLPWHRGILSLGMTTVLLACVVWQAQCQFNAAYATSRPDAAESPTVQDYLNYGR
jgi:hypothetical protein